MRWCATHRVVVEVPGLNIRDSVVLEQELAARWLEHEVHSGPPQ